MIGYVDSASFLAHMWGVDPMVSEHVFWDAAWLVAFLRSAKFDVVTKARSVTPSVLRSLACSDFTVNDCRLSPPISTVGTILQEMVEIGVPLGAAEMWRVDGRRFDRCILVATPSREHFMTTPGDIRFLTLQLHRDEFLAHWHLLIGAEREAGGGVIELTSGEHRRFRALAEAMVSYMTRGNGLAVGDPRGDSRFPAAWRSVFLDATILALAGAMPRLPMNAMRRIMNNAIEYLRLYPFASPSMRDLCAVCATNERSLRHAFVRTVGVGPRAYLRLRRLHLARRRLQHVVPHGASVAQIATDHGFFDLGRFAGDYRQLFGELPSQTLRRR